jgi:HEAT repeat protein
MLIAAIPLAAMAQEPQKRVPTPKKPEIKVETKVHVDVEPRFKLKQDFDFNFEPLIRKTQELEWQSQNIGRAFAKMDREHAIEMRAQDMALRQENMKMRAEDVAQQFAMRDWDRAVNVKIEPPRFDLFSPKSDRLLSGQPAAPWSSEDPADSLYRQAREALNRGEYRRAASLFSDITKKFPKSVYANDCAYWEAFARYRSGTTDDLKQALKILDGIDVALLRGREGSVDVPALRARVQAALAARGDQQAAAALQKEAANKETCDREDIAVRAEALSALGQMDPASAMPVVKKVLQKRDECSVELRRRALYVVGRQSDPEAANVILDVAKNDPDRDLRSEAMRWLPRVAGDNAVPQLEEILRTSTDENTQRNAVYALASIDTEKARRAVRTLIERNDAAESVRREAILSLSREREGRGISTEEIQYLRGLYGKLEAPKLREAILTSVSRIETSDNTAFLITVAKNQNETTSLRVTSIQRLGRMESVPVAEIAKLYDVADARSLREQILYALGNRKEPEAIDKLIEVARKDTDPNIRRTAINILSRSNNPRAVQMMKDLIGGDK